MSKTFDLSAMSVPDLEKLIRSAQDEITRRQNQSGLKPGDMVTHRDGSFHGEAPVLEIAKSGVRAQVRTHWGTAYYSISKLQKVGG